MKALKTSLFLLAFIISLLAQKTIFPYRAKVVQNADVFAKPNLLSEELFRVFEGDTVTIKDTEMGWWKIVDKGGDVGFVMNVNLLVTDENILEYRKEKLDEHIKSENIEAARKKKEAEEKRYKSLVEKYSKTTADRLLKGTIRIGDTKEMVIEARDKPSDINRSVGSWGVHEQWVYPNIYLYFENGKLTGWQD